MSANLGLNPYAADTHRPLDDAWRSLSVDVWNLRPGKKWRPPKAPPNVPPPPRSLAVQFTQQTLLITADPSAILPERADRQYLLIQNATGSGVIYIGFNEVPSIQTGIEIIAGGSIELRDPACANGVYVVCPGGTATVRVLEG